jgi:alpha-galactosidase
VVGRPTYAQRERWADAARELGGLRSFSDRVADLDDWGLDTVRALLSAGGRAEALPDALVRDAARIAEAEAR